MHNHSADSDSADGSDHAEMMDDSDDCGALLLMMKSLTMLIIIFLLVTWAMTEGE